jgi:hypothetical protein
LFTEAILPFTSFSDAMIIIVLYKIELFPQPLFL